MSETVCSGAAPRNIVVIPAFDEEATIASIVEEVRIQGYPVIVVNDASTDGTSSAARSAGALVLDLPCRHGAWDLSIYPPSPASWPPASSQRSSAHAPRITFQ